MDIPPKTKVHEILMALLHSRKGEFCKSEKNVFLRNFLGGDNVESSNDKK